MFFEYAADLHIHTALSPCAGDVMEPRTIIERSTAAGLKIIAITDHNSSKNVPAVQEIAKNADIYVIPGIEVQSNEEIHIICLFPDYVKCSAFQRVIDNNLGDIMNNPKLFGEQLILDSKGRCVGREDRLLIQSVDLSIEEIFTLAREKDGICIPAHIDRPSFSILANLGFFPALDYVAFEVAAERNLEILKKKHGILNKYSIILSSDAHFPDEIGGKKVFLNIKKSSFEEVVKALRDGDMKIKEVV